MPKIVACLITLSLFLFFHPTIFAASVTVDSIPTSLNEEQEFTVMVNVSGAAANTTNYLRAAFYSETSPTSYFGYTFNHLEAWYNGTPSPIDPHQFLQIQIGPDGTWTGDLKSKADIAASSFKGSGNYYFKIGRYTASATSISDWSQSTPVSISSTAPSPTPTPSPSPSTSQSSSSTKSPSPTPKATTPPTPAKSPQPSPLKSPNSVLGERTEEQLLLTSTPEASPVESPNEEGTQNSSKTKIAVMLAGSGIILIGLSVAFFVLYNRVLNKSANEEKKEN